jgi:hypothetical protein
VIWGNPVGERSFKPISHPRTPATRRARATRPLAAPRAASATRGPRGTRREAPGQPGAEADPASAAQMERPTPERHRAQVHPCLLVVRRGGARNRGPQRRPTCEIKPTGMEPRTRWLQRDPWIHRHPAWGTSMHGGLGEPPQEIGTKLVRRSRPRKPIGRQEGPAVARPFSMAGRDSNPRPSIMSLRLGTTGHKCCSSWYRTP